MHLGNWPAVDETAGGRTGFVYAKLNDAEPWKGGRSAQGYAGREEEVEDLRQRYGRLGDVTVPLTRRRRLSFWTAIYSFFLGVPQYTANVPSNEPCPLY